jgi:hypothetical protein
MSESKQARRLRRVKARKQMNRQLRIVSFYYPAGSPGHEAKAKGVWRKQHALNCGRSSCQMCCNPRRILKAVTLYEQRFNQAFKQDLEAIYQEKSGNGPASSRPNLRH